MRKGWLPRRLPLRFSWFISTIIPLIAGVMTLTSGSPAYADHLVCTVEARGTFANRDSFNGKVSEDELGSASGHWVHVAPGEGSVLVARSIDDIFCSINGISAVSVLGSGLWNGQPVEFAVVIAIDNSGLTPNYYAIDVTPVGGGTAIYSMCCLPVRSDITVSAPAH